MKDEVVNEFAKSLLSVKRDLHFCSICGNITEEDPCEICRNLSRDRSVILVVEEPKDVMAMEKMREYHGLYHVLHGVLSPMEGTGPED
ncbi:toprim domain-containing protein, partial [Pseudomonas aeruginosa]